MSEIGVPSRDERITAAIAHASVLLGLLTSGVGGIVATMVIWLVQKEKSRYVAFHALQAFVYQVASLLLAILGWCCWFALFMLATMVPVSINPGAYEMTPPATMWVALVLGLVPIVVWVLLILYGVWAALRTFDGQDFEYLIIGRWLRNSGG